MTRWIRNEGGYSLVELLAAITILSIAIIPMVGMFDAGLRSASTSGNYDRARTFAIGQLDLARSMSYASVRDAYPVSGSTPNDRGLYTNDSAPIPSGSDVPSGAKFKVEKQYLVMPGSSGACTGDLDAEACRSKLSQGLIKVTITVSWTGGSYTTSGLVTR